MAARHIALSLSAAITAAIPAQAADTPDCHTAAVEFAASVWHASPRLKIPVWTVVGAIVGRPGWFAVLAANAESPRERRMVASFTVWCMAGSVGDPPSVPPRWLELF